MASKMIYLLVICCVFYTTEGAPNAGQADEAATPAPTDGKGDGATPQSGSGGSGSFPFLDTKAWFTNIGKIIPPQGSDLWQTATNFKIPGLNKREVKTPY